MSELKDKDGNIRPEVEAGDFKPSSGGARFYVGGNAHPIHSATFAKWDEATGTWQGAEPLKDPTPVAVNFTTSKIKFDINLSEIDEELLGVLNGAMGEATRRAMNEVLFNGMPPASVNFNDAPWVRYDEPETYRNPPFSAAAWQDEILNRPRAGCYRSPIQKPPTVHPAPPNFRGQVQASNGAAYSAANLANPRYPTKLTDDGETVIDFTE